MSSPFSLNDASRARVLAGKTLQQKPPPSLQDPNARCVIPGHDGWFGLNETMFSKHIMVIGGIGSGKTNLLYKIIHQIQGSLKENELLLIFDTKGDFLEKFNDDKSIVISNDDNAKGLHGPDSWNIFREVMFGAPSAFDKSVYEMAMEISTSLFADKLHKTQQVFFPQAARDLFCALLVCQLRNMERLGCKYPQNYLNNESFRGFADRASSSLIVDLLKGHSDFASISSYIDTEGTQTQGVFSELQQGIREFFVGKFSTAGNLSIRELVHRKGGVTVFIEYDIARSESLAPIFRLLIDLALKEAMGRMNGVQAEERGNVWIIIDEFSLLPKLKYISNALNFGRSLGLKIIIGFQDFNQLIVAYEEAAGRTIAAGCSTIFAFNVQEPKTVEFVRDLFGKHLELGIHLDEETLSNSPGAKVDVAHVVKEWDIMSLGVGECIVSIRGHDPFKFRTLPYDKAELREYVRGIRMLSATRKNGLHATDDDPVAQLAHYLRSGNALPRGYGHGIG